MLEEIGCLECGSRRLYCWVVEEREIERVEMYECADCVDRKCRELREELQLENDSIGGC